MTKFNLKEHIAKNKATFFGSLNENVDQSEEEGKGPSKTDLKNQPETELKESTNLKDAKSAKEYVAMSLANFYSLDPNIRTQRKEKLMDLKLDGTDNIEDIATILEKRPEFYFNLKRVVAQAVKDSKKWFPNSVSEELSSSPVSSFSEWLEGIQKIDPKVANDFEKHPGLKKVSSKEEFIKLAKEVGELYDESETKTEYKLGNTIYVSEYPKTGIESISLSSGLDSYGWYTDETNNRLSTETPDQKRNRVYPQGSKMDENKTTTKMKKSDLKAKIKEMIVAEMNVNEDTFAPPSETDFLAEVDRILAEADEVAVDDTEVSVDGEENVNVDTTVEVDPNVKAVQDALTQAQAAAQKLGDSKLTDQIGNTITFFTRAHVVEKGAVAEGDKEYYKDAEADDAEHIKALEKDMEDDKKSSMNESMFPILKRILK